MPLYDYKCDKCGQVFEAQQRITEAPLKHCPKCQGPVKRLISAAGIIFKGSGFHVTDYARKSTIDNGKSKIGSDKKDAKPKKTKETKSSAKDASQPPSK